MPEPRSGEGESDFMARCVPQVLDEGTASDSDQAVAVCFSMWEDGKEADGSPDRTEGHAGEVSLDHLDLEIKEIGDSMDDTQLENQENCETCDDKEAKMFGEMGNPYGVTSFAELEAAEKAEMAAMEVGDLTYKFQKLARNIMNSDIENKAVALGSLANEYAALVDEKMAMKEAEIAEAEKSAPVRQPEVGKSFWAKVKEWLFEDDSKQAPESNFMVWKEKSGDYRWFAIYSNNYRDDDGTPEIISAAAHKEFVAAVDKGEWPMPELWGWHVDYSRHGIADWIAYDDDTGFAMASGRGDPGKEAVFENLEKQNVLVSHGMPHSEIQRDPDDPTIITRYRTREISHLPAWAAANKHTGFGVVTRKENNMIPDEKRKYLEELGLNVDGIEAQLEERKTVAEAEGRESKEKDIEAVEAAEVPEAQEAQPEPEPQPVLTADVIADAMRQAMEPLSARIAELEGELKALKEKPEPEPVEEKSELDDMTPAASLAAQIASRVIGNPNAYIDGRTKEAKDAPKEKEPGAEGVLNSGNPLADSMVNRLVTGQTMKELANLRQQ